MKIKKIAKILVSVGAILAGIGKVILDVSEKETKRKTKKK